MRWIIHSYHEMLKMILNGIPIPITLKVGLVNMWFYFFNILYFNLFFPFFIPTSIICLSLDFREGENIYLYIYIYIYYWSTDDVQSCPPTDKSFEGKYLNNKVAKATKIV
jgi:hypothetical protein